MYLIVLGAGPEGASLIDLAVQSGHEVALIEADEERARSVLKKHDIAVFQTSITTGGILEEMEGDRADALVATTNDDATNLMAMILGRRSGIDTLVSMVHEPQHQPMFEEFGVKVLTQPEVIVAKQLYHCVDASNDESS